MIFVPARFDEACPTVIADKYQVRGVLGVGGMGTVYDAVHAITQRPVALKVMHAWVAKSSATAGPRFVQEAKTSAQIGHPSVVDVIDAGQDENGHYYLAMEHLRGETLAQRLERGPMSEAELIEMATALLEGLSAAHDKALIHRDIKPDNIFIAETRDGDTAYKLLDFGIVKKLGQRVTAMGSVVGTVEFMSPEQATGRSIDGRSDLWNLGAVLFCALVGRPPYPSKNHAALIRQIANGAPPAVRSLAPHCSERLAAVIDRSLRPIAKDRWASAQEMKSALGLPPPATTTRETHATAPVATLPASTPEPETRRQATPVTLEASRTGPARAGAQRPPPVNAEKQAPAPARAKAPPLRPKWRWRLALSIGLLGAAAAGKFIYRSTSRAEPDSARTAARASPRSLQVSGSDSHEARAPERPPPAQAAGDDNHPTR